MERVDWLTKRLWESPVVDQNLEHHIIAYFRILSFVILYNSILVSRLNNIRTVHWKTYVSIQASAVRVWALAE